MAYSNFFHIKEDGDYVEFRFLKTVIDEVDCVINKKTVARKDKSETYWNDRHDEVPTIDKHFGIECGDVLYVSEAKSYHYDEPNFTNDSPLTIVLYKQGKGAEVIYCYKRQFSILKDIVLDAFCVFKDGKMAPLDSSMFTADRPRIPDVAWDMGYLHNRVYKDDVHRHTCEFHLNEANDIYRKMFTGISNQCI